LPHGPNYGEFPNLTYLNTRIASHLFFLITDYLFLYFKNIYKKNLNFVYF
jgi:hypothetical protein